MKISDIIKSENLTLSFEVFPPKISTKFESVKRATENVAALKPHFMSVTYGAGGGTSAFTVDIAKSIQEKYNIPVMAHLSCISSTKDGVKKQLQAIKDAGITNIMALRGDIPADSTLDRSSLDYHYACELVEEIKAFDSSFCVGGACYPEVHPESENQKKDIEALKLKVEAGCEFLTTQMFFDNNIFYNFLYKLREGGVTVPIVPGIMPITKVEQVKKAIQLSGTQVPMRFRYMIDKFGSDPEAMRQAGIIYASAQILDLYANGIKSVHVYTMNNSYVAKAIMDNLSEIIK
ncbi:MAG: methylenetetrahydrofolate reductase [NAD(P)H] [Sphaerochaetaceae bacterium]|nr:methylenetetrahydrofolate reductase [NAD(P)H] [Sphaerochaetaceae bacterium]